jgi:hypothetical protein
LPYTCHCPVYIVLSFPCFLCVLVSSEIVFKFRLPLEWNEWFYSETRFHGLIPFRWLVICHIPCSKSHSSCPRDHPKETSCPTLCDRYTDSTGQYTSHKAKSRSIAFTTATAPCNNHYETLTHATILPDIPQKNKLLVKLVQKESKNSLKIWTLNVNDAFFPCLCLGIWNGRFFWDSLIGFLICLP